MFTPEQEAFLIDLANKGLAEIADAAQRERDIEASMAARAAITAALADLEVRQAAEKQALIESLQVKP